MKNLNRRDFLKTLAAIPFLAWLKPEAVEVESAEVELVPVDKVVYLQEPEGIVSWSGERWSSLAIGPDGSIYIGGAAFINPPTSNDEYWARWNGQEFERITSQSLITDYNTMVAMNK
jgi:hypothetical protein